MATPELPPRPQPPPQIRGMFPTSTDGATTWLPPEHRLTVAQRMAMGIVKQLTPLGLPTIIQPGSPLGIVELRITNTSTRVSRPGAINGAIDGGVFVAMLVDTMTRELAPLGITTTAEFLPDTVHIALNTIPKGPLNA